MDDVFFDHEHDDEGPPSGVEETNPFEGREWFHLKSVGIDIGSSTSHLMVSELVLVRQGIALSSRFQVVKKDIVYESPILLTPYQTPELIDSPRLGSFIGGAYREAGVSPHTIDTGAVIITGEAAGKQNAPHILGLFAEQAGKFVCATAGPNLEAKMAAYGSGAAAASSNGATVLNVDVGGGTCKLALCRHGEVQATAAINVGARLLAFDAERRLSRLEHAGADVCHALGLQPRLGHVLGAEAEDRVAGQLAACLFEFLQGKPSPLTESLAITGPFPSGISWDKVFFSGGVSEYIYGCEDRDFGDLGRPLSREIRRLADGLPLAIPQQRIRSTVVGACQYTVQVSGNTIYVSSPGVLPVHNLPVLAQSFPEDGVGPKELAESLTDALARHDLALGEGPLALAYRWSASPTAHRLQDFCRGLCAALGPHLRRGLPLVLALDTDIARLLGHALQNELPPDYPIVSVDGLDLQDFDYIDIGSPLEAGVVPVVIKSLVFR